MMIDRRGLLTWTGWLGAMAPEGAGGGAAIAAGQPSDRAVQDIVTALNSIKSAIAAQQTFTEVAQVRIKQMDFLKAQGKFPDFIEVGTDIWTAVYDWHVRFQQPMTLGRDGNGRYTITLAFTTLILRPDLVATLIGLPFDNR
jgi:hypothetical protein